MLMLGQHDVEREALNRVHTLKRGGASLMVSIKEPQGVPPRVTRAVLVIHGQCPVTEQLASELKVVAKEGARHVFEVHDHEGQRLDVRAPRLSDLVDAELQMVFMKHQAAA